MNGFDSVWRHACSSLPLLPRALSTPCMSFSYISYILQCDITNAAAVAHSTVYFYLHKFHSLLFIDGIHRLARRKISLRESNAKCSYLKKLTCQGTLRQNFYMSEALSPPMTPYLPPLTHCIRVFQTNKISKQLLHPDWFISALCRLFHKWEQV